MYNMFMNNRFLLLFVIHALGTKSDWSTFEFVSCKIVNSCFYIYLFAPPRILYFNIKFLQIVHLLLARIFPIQNYVDVDVCACVRVCALRG